MAEGANWGIVGTGAVARDFSRALGRTPGAKAVAVASSRKAKAEAFAAECGVEQGLDSVERLVALPHVDVVYVASATRLHEAHCLAALDAGKAVLCEKPFTGSEAQAAAVVARAREARLFCMEAMWTRFNGVVRGLKAGIDGGKLGAVSGAAFSLGYGKTLEGAEAANPDRSNIRNFGCYAISLAVHLFGPVTEWKATGRRNSAGLDTDLSLILVHAKATSLIDVSSTVTRPNRLDVFGSKANARIPAALVNPCLLEIHPHGRGGLGALIADAAAPLRARLPAARRRAESGIGGEIAEVRRCIGEGRLESAIMPLDETLAVQRLMDAVAASF